MKLSVITINFNNRDGLRKTIESVVNQTYKEFEYIVIDGGSNDGSVDVIKEYADRIDYWVSEPDKGIYNAMNKGIDVAKGEYCLFLNSGDYFFNSNVINDCVPHMDGIDVLSGHLLHDNGFLVRAPKNITVEYLYFDTLSHPATFIKTILLKEFHYDENLKIVGDWKFFVQILIYKNSSYKPLDVVISVFNVFGISAIDRSLCRNERESVLKKDFPIRIYDYFLGNTVGTEQEFYNEIRKSKYHKYIYTLNVLFLRFISLFKKNTWVHKYPLKLDK